MAWLLQSPDDSLIIDEISKQTDRGAALIATAYLEERLLAAIKARTNRHKLESWFYGGGPVGTFSAKIDLGFLLGIYDDETRRNFRTVKDIRNEFAHEPEPRDFNSERIRDLCKNINLDVTMELKTNEQTYEIAFTPDGTPKTAFLNAIKWLLFITDMETKQQPLRRPAPTILEVLGIGGQSSPEKS